MPQDKRDLTRAWRRRWLYGTIPVLAAAVVAAWFWLKFSLADDPASFSVYPTRPNFSRLVLVTGCLAAYFAVYGLISIVNGHTTRREALGYLIIWSVLPPLFFFLEWFVFFPAFGDPHKVEAFKNGQDAARNLWAGIVAAFAVLQFVDQSDKPAGSS